MPDETSSWWNIDAIDEKVEIFDDVELDNFCLTHFSDVFDKFGDGMRKDKKINLLLNYCRKTSGRQQELLECLSKKFPDDLQIQAWLDTAGKVSSPPPSPSHQLEEQQVVDIGPPPPILKVLFENKGRTCSIIIIVVCIFVVFIGLFGMISQVTKPAELIAALFKSTPTATATSTPTVNYTFTSTPTNTPTPTATPESSIPTPIPTDTPAQPEVFLVSSNYDPSGYMGDTGDITVAKLPNVDQFIYETEGRGPHEFEFKYIGGELNPNPAQFAGVMYLNPPGAFGTDPDGGHNLQNFQRVLKWEARSVEGEVNVEFVIGGVTWIWDDQTQMKKPALHPDTMGRTSLGTKTLTKEWQSFEYDLSHKLEEEFERVVGGFAWVISWGSNGLKLKEDKTGPEESETFIIEIRNIRYER